MEAVFEHPDGRVIVADAGGEWHRITIEPSRPSTYVARSACSTRYPLEIIERLLELKGVSYLCDEIAREEDPQYIERKLRHAMLGYVGEDAFAGRRILDFGSGAGSSAMVLTRLFPRTEIVGVELMEDFVEIARARACFQGADNVRFAVSPSAEQLPPQLGMFDFVSLSAVWEHLLPPERPVLARTIWLLLQPGGILFLNETPHRWYPFEYHTTGLPLLNYIPKTLAYRAASRFSRRVDGSVSWEDLLRAGIRGGTEHEVLKALSAVGDGTPVSLTPVRVGRDKVDLWYAFSRTGRPRRGRRLARALFKAISRLVGEDFTPSLELAIKKT
jgi:2-polyprenyl-3-methyl-5-hydroxy-6-metoxy-1,4-benzoquinol methylase